jgi:hypothetical protein
MQYQRNYRRIWVLNRLGLVNEQWNVYFQRMAMLLQDPPLDLDTWLEELRTLAYQLYNIPGGRQVLAFSSCTKLAHIVNNHLPIYDSKVASFYLWRPPGGNVFEKRIQLFLGFYERLTEEYGRVIREGLLDDAIEAFRHQFATQGCTDERIIDLLIWSWVRFCEEQSLVGGFYQ